MTFYTLLLLSGVVRNLYFREPPGTSNMLIHKSFLQAYDQHQSLLQPKGKMDQQVSQHSCRNISTQTAKGKEQFQIYRKKREKLKLGPALPTMVTLNIKLHTFTLDVGRFSIVWSLKQLRHQNYTELPQKSQMTSCSQPNESDMCSCLVL